MASTSKLPQSDAVFVVPGEKLGETKQFSGGEGTFVRADGIFASVAGFRSEDSAKKVLSVTRSTSGGANNTTKCPTGLATDQVLKLQDHVVCRVVRIQSHQVTVEILLKKQPTDKSRSGEFVTLQEKFAGMIRLEDVRSFDLDKVVLEEMFPSGALVLASVLSFGNMRSYFLSTAQPGLGVIRVDSNGSPS